VRMVKVLMVLGMHRSGTSAIAGVLSKLGGGAPKNLLEANGGNERGFFESAPMMGFHDELLASAGTDWADWRAFDPAWYGSALRDAYNDRAKRLFQEEFGDSPLAIFKDPRICRFLPFWLDVFVAMDISPHIVIPVRSPLEVAGSLKKRNGLTLPQGLLLWLRHVLDAEAATRTLPRSVIRWSEFLLNWRAAVDKISRDIDLSWPRLFDESAHEINQFLSEDLVHHKVDDEELAAHADLHEWTIGAYQSLLEMAGGPESYGSKARLDRIRERLNESGALFGRILADADSTARELSSEAASLQAERDHWRARNAALEADLSDKFAVADRRFDEATAKHAALGAELNATRLDNEKLITQMSAFKLRAETAKLAASKLVKDKKALELTLRQMRLQSERAAAELSTQTAKNAGAIKTLSDQLVDAEAALSHLEAEARKRTFALKLTPRPLRKRKLVRQLVRSGLFDPNWYSAQYAEIKYCGLTPAMHYLEKGFRQGYFPNPLFDTRWYLQRYEDVRRSGANPLLHYAAHGYREGRDPGPGFQTTWYLEANPDVKRSGMNPLAHFLRFGHAEGRAPVPEGD
jgi:hypothetical protein